MDHREHVHLIGIGGTGMTALAGLLHESGCRVTGSDRALYPPTSDLLAEMGLAVHVGFDPAHLAPAPDLVVIGNAVRRGNPEAEEVLDRDLPYRSMPQILSERFLANRHSIVVAGTHGKTTTSAMLARVLDHAGRSPGFLIGGAPLDFERPFRVGAGSAFVIEGDEYDSAFFDKGPKFMHYRPDTALVGTIEFDHADIFRDLEHVKSVFRWLTNIVPRRGLIVRHEDCADTREVTGHALCRVEGYGLVSGRWRADAVEVSDDGCTGFQIARDGVPFGDRVILRTGGDHNVRNALAVAAAAYEQDVPAEGIVAGLSSFRGVRRRMEIRAEIAGITVVDDFAHHPTAIGETLRAARRRFPDRKIWAVFEPRSWSMRRNVFQQRLTAALAVADEVALARVYGARELEPAERLDPEKIVRDLRSAGVPARHHSDVDAIVEDLVARCGSGDVVVVMSNGSFDGLHDRLIRRLEVATP